MFLKYYQSCLNCFAVVFMLLLCSGAVVGGNCCNASSSKNVILVTISSLRADHTSCFGYSRETTPVFDEFAAENILFTNAFSTSSWMMPSTGSLFTSLYPFEHSATHIDERLRIGVLTLADILKWNGYYTAGFTSDPRLSSEKGFGQGFWFYDDYSVELLLESVGIGEGIEINMNQVRTNGLINDAVIRWLSKNSAETFFLYVNYYDNHWDYLPPSPYDELFDCDYSGIINGRGISKEPLYSNKPSQEDLEHMIALYDGELRCTDDDLGELLDFLEQSGKMDDCLVVICGEHGEEFYEHGHTSHHGVYDEHIHIPLAVHLPAEEYEGIVIDSLVSVVDIMPTILEYAGIRETGEYRGRSLMSVIDGDSDEVRESLFIEYTGGAEPDAFAVRSKRYKVIRSEGKVFGFDLSKDPLEQEGISHSDFNDEMDSLYGELREVLNMSAGRK